MAEWIALVSFNDKGDGAGFWQADLFHGEYAEEPETFFTMKTGDTKSATIDKARSKWPRAEIHVEDTCVQCDGCGEIDDGDGLEDCGMCGGEGKHSAVWSGR